MGDVVIVCNKVNLLTTSWIPVRCKNGEIKPVSVLQLTQDYKTNPITDIATGRPDLDGAMHQFLIGVIQRGCMPDKAFWRKKQLYPPNEHEIEEWITPLLPAFETGRFMMAPGLNKVYFTQKKKKQNPVESLLLGNKNEFFVKSGNINHMCETCFPLAVYTLQTNAPQGGAGHLTSLRGGGPATTLVMGRTLWETIWRNVITREEYLDRQYGDLNKIELGSTFLWMAETCSGDIYPADMHPAHVYWGMPRRIYAEPRDYDEPCVCGICGKQIDYGYDEYYTETHGAKYDASVWRHPLTPYYKSKGKKLTLRPLHLKDDGISYSRFPLCAFDDSAYGVNALVVHKHMDRTADASLEIWIFGYHTNDASVMGWYEGRMSLPIVEESIQSDYERTVLGLVDAAKHVATRLKVRMSRAIGGAPSTVATRFWADTEFEFFDRVTQLRDVLHDKGDVTELNLSWLSYLSEVALSLYDEYAVIENNSDQQRIQDIVKNRRNLFFEISISNDTICSVLGLSKPDGGDKSGRKRKKSRK